MTSGTHNHANRAAHIDARRRGYVEDIVFADWHAGRSFDGLARHKLGRIAIEVLDALDEGSAMDGFRCIG
jgi:hypothetical protein